MTDPFYFGPPELRPKRVLTELPLSERPEHVDPPNQVRPEDITRLFDGFAFEINRATALINEVEPRAKRLFVPVDPDAVQVRAALRRKIPGSNGDQIPFDLYKDLLDFRVKTARKLKIEVVSELTGDLLTDGAKIKKYLRTGQKGMSSWDEFLLTMEQFTLWFLLNQLLGTFSSVEHQEVCAAKSPPGTEIGPITLRQAIAMAAMMLILGMREDHVILAVSAPADALKIPPVDIINRARRLSQSDLHREVTEIVGASDHQIIIDYADQYVGRNPVGYEDWIAYRDLRHIREYTVTTYVHSHQYSKEYNTLLDYSFEGIHTTPIADGGNAFINGALGIPRRGTTVEYSGINDMPPAHYVALANQLAMIDKNISSIAGVLTSGFSLDLLCCVGRFLGKNDIHRLRKIRTVLQAAYNFSSAKSIQINSPGNVLDFAVYAIQQEVIAFAQRYFDKVLNDILKWTSETNDETWQDLFACPLIEDLMLQILGAIGRFRDEIFKMIDQFIGQSYTFGEGVQQRWGLIYDARRIRTLISIIDGILATIEACADLEDAFNVDDPTSTDPSENPNIYSGVPQPLVLPETVIAKFFANPNPVIRGENMRPIPPVGRIVSSGEPATINNFREICRGILPDELLAAVFKSKESA